MHEVRWPRRVDIGYALGAAQQQFVAVRGVDREAIHAGFEAEFLVEWFAGVTGGLRDHCQIFSLPRVGSMVTVVAERQAKSEPGQVLAVWPGSLSEVVTVAMFCGARAFEVRFHGQC